MLMTARWRRIAEYWPPFAVMFALLRCSHGFRAFARRLQDCPAMSWMNCNHFLIAAHPPNRLKTTFARHSGEPAAPLWLELSLWWFCFSTYVLQRTTLVSSKPHSYYKAGAEWMRANVLPAQTVFNTDWDDFPRLFYYDPSHNYVTGLDPTYLFDKNPALSKLYDRITLGDEENPGPLIRDRFGASYVFTDNGHDKFFNNAIESGWFEIVYEDTDCTILHITRSEERASTRGA